MVNPGATNNPHSRKRRRCMPWGPADEAPSAKKERRRYGELLRDAYFGYMEHIERLLWPDKPCRMFALSEPRHFH